MTGDFVNNISYTEELQQVRQEGDLPWHLWQCPIEDALKRILKNDKHTLSLLSAYPTNFCLFKTLEASLRLEFASIIAINNTIWFPFKDCSCMNLPSNPLNLLIHLSYCGHQFRCWIILLLNCSSLLFLMSLHIKIVWQAQSFLRSNYCFNNLRII